MRFTVKSHADEDIDQTVHTSSTAVGQLSQNIAEDTPVTEVFHLIRSIHPRKDWKFCHLSVLAPGPHGQFCFGLEIIGQIQQIVSFETREPEALRIGSV